MRQLGIAALLGIVGSALAAVLVRVIAAGTTSLSENWLIAGSILPVLGVVLGAILAHRISGGVDPWPVTPFSRRIPFAIVGGILGSLTWYASYVELSALWNNQNFLALVLHPSAVPTLSSTNGSGPATDVSILMYPILGLLIGAWVTDTAIKRKLTS